LIAGIRYSGSEYRLRDCCIQYREQFGLIMNILKQKDSAMGVIQLFTHQEDFLRYPAPSKRIGIARVSNLRQRMKVVPLKLCHKAIHLPYKNGTFIAMTLNSQLS